MKIDKHLFKNSKWRATQVSLPNIILRQNTSIPLMSDVLSILGNSEHEVLSCLDLKDVYHSIPLTDKSKEYCSILLILGALFTDMRSC